MIPTLVHVSSTPGLVVLAVLGGAVLVVAGMALVVVAPRGEYRVVTRGGTVRRVIESGPGWRLPGVDEVVPLPAAEHEHTLMVRAKTLDGEDVLVLAEAVVRLQPPAEGLPFTDPWPAAEESCTTVLRDLVATLPVAEIGRSLRSARPQLEENIRRNLRVGGVVLVHLEIVEVDLPLSGHSRDGT